MLKLRSCEWLGMMCQYASVLYLQLLCAAALYDTRDLSRVELPLVVVYSAACAGLQTFLQGLVFFVFAVLEAAELFS